MLFGQKWPTSQKGRTFLPQRKGENEKGGGSDKKMEGGVDCVLSLFN